MKRHRSGRRYTVAPAAIMLGILSACAAINGCGGGGGGGPSGPGSVSGTVVDLDTQAPINGATVTISGEQDTTDLFGAFQVPGLQNGPQMLTAAASSQGYIDGSLQVDVQGATALPSPIQLAKQSSGPPPPPASISGSVGLNGSLPPGGSITVEAVNQATGPPPTDSTTLTAPGAYGLLVPGAATYTVTASATGFQSQSQNVTLPNLGDTASNVDFTLNP